MLSSQDFNFYTRRMLSSLCDVAPNRGTSSRRAQRLPEKGARPDQISVSGVSSGGAMATQMHIAHSHNLKGVGVIAGVAYDSADSSQPYFKRVLRGVYKSVNGIAYLEPDPEEVMEFAVERTRKAFVAGGIDDPHRMGDQRIWLFHGLKDKKIAHEAMLGMWLHYLNYVAGEHTFLLDDLAVPHAHLRYLPGVELPDADSPYVDDPPVANDSHIVDIGYNATGRILEFIYGALHENNNDNVDRGRFIEFDQSEFVGYQKGGELVLLPPESVGLADTGFAYIPSNYDEGHGRVHVAFHGCEQCADLTMEYVYDSGYNKWAEANNIIILYPQTIGTSSPLNPKACWDWWGYANPSRHRTDYARKDGYQVSAVWRMLERLMDGPPKPPKPGYFGPPRLFKGDATNDSVALVWDQNDAPAYFHIYRRGPRVSDACVVCATGSSYVDRGLREETAYDYQIAAVYADGRVSHRCDVLSVETLPTAMAGTGVLSHSAIAVP